MTSRWPTRAEMSSMLSLAAPIVVMQLGMMLYGVVDTLYMGRLGAHAVSAVGLGGSTFFTLFIFGIGTLLGIDALSSRAHGAGEARESVEVLVHALVVAVGVAALVFAILHAAGPFYRAMGVAPGVAEGALEYLRTLRWMIFPGLCFVACRQYLQSVDVTRPLLLGILAGNVCNVVFNYVLIYGKFGFPALGITGCAAASVANSVVMLAFAATAAYWKAGESRWRFSGWRPKLFGDLARLGLPSGLQMLIEVSFFSLVTTLMGRFGEVPTAAHQITMNLASLAFMVPLGVSFAASVRVGQGIGRGDPEGAVGSGRSALALAVGFMACMAAVFWTVPGPLVRLYTSEPEVVRLAVSMLTVAALFQVFDGTQVVLTGALRGFGETRLQLVTNLAGFTFIGLPFGYWLAFRAGAGPRGLWIGLLTGLAAVAVLLFVAWRRRAAAYLGAR